MSETLKKYVCLSRDVASNKEPQTHQSNGNAIHECRKYWQNLKARIFYVILNPSATSFYMNPHQSNMASVSDMGVASGCQHTRTPIHFEEPSSTCRHTSNISCALVSN